MQALYPKHVAAPEDEALLARYDCPARPFVRFNFVSSLDGSAQVQGRSGALGTAADARVFALLRRLASVIVVGSGTVRAEGYAGPLLDAPGRAWRTAHGMAEHPTLAIITRSLSVGPEDPVITDSPAPVLLFTGVRPDAAQRAEYPAHVQLITLDPVPGYWCDAAQLVAELHSRGLGFIHAEGGPHVFGQFIAQDAVDSLCLSMSPLLVAGDGDRISHAAAQARVRLALASVLEEDGMLLTEYRRHAGPSAPGRPGAPSA